ncbi:MAG: 3-oxoacyl-ACP synthase [Flavobacteriales bacterium]
MDKSRVHSFCRSLVEKRIHELKQQLELLRSDAESEGKSTAGDKHETGRAMIQLEQEQLGKQLQEQEQLLAALLQWSNAVPTTQVNSGSLVKTNNGYFYLAVGLGKITMDDQVLFVLSALSPLGKNLLSKKIGEQFTVNGVLYEVESIQ